MPAGAGHGGQHVLARAHDGHAERLDPVDAGVGRVERARDRVEADLALEAGLEIAAQVNHPRSIERCGADHAARRYQSVATSDDATISRSQVTRGRSRRRAAATINASNGSGFGPCPSARNHLLDAQVQGVVRRIAEDKHAARGRVEYAIIAASRLRSDGSSWSRRIPRPEGGRQCNVSRVPALQQVRGPAPGFGGFAPVVRLVLAAAALLAMAAAGAAAQVVERVVDGDTIVVRDVGRVRLIGVDTPETVHPGRPVEFFGKEASAFTKRLVDGKRVRLDYDQQRTDRYGRTLAYVHLPDGTFVNAEIIRRGYGHAYTPLPLQVPRAVPRARARCTPAPAAACGGSGAPQAPPAAAPPAGATAALAPLGRQRQRPDLLRRGPAARHRAGAPRPSRVPSHARRRQRRRRVRVSRGRAAGAPPARPRTQPRERRGMLNYGMLHTSGRHFLQIPGPPTSRSASCGRWPPRSSTTAGRRSATSRARCSAGWRPSSARTSRYCCFRRREPAPGRPRSSTRWRPATAC